MKMKIAGKFMAAAILLFTGMFFTACSLEKSETWEIDSLEEIGGHGVSVNGDPEVIETEIGTAVYFDGDGDMLLVDNNPIGEAKAFTVEVVFKPDSSHPENTAPRFIHFQDPDDKNNKRLMIELRINERNQCYLDGYLRSDSGFVILIDENLVHPVNRWLHVAVTYDNEVMTTYFNGEKELDGPLAFAETIINPVGKVAIGGRMNHREYFKGYIKTLKVTHAALDPKDFIRIKAITYTHIN